MLLADEKHHDDRQNTDDRAGLDQLPAPARLISQQRQPQVMVMVSTLVRKINGPMRLFQESRKVKMPSVARAASRVAGRCGSRSG